MQKIASWYFSQHSSAYEKPRFWLNKTFLINLAFLGFSSVAKMNTMLYLFSVEFGQVSLSKHYFAVNLNLLYTSPNSSWRDMVIWSNICEIAAWLWETLCVCTVPMHQGELGSVITQVWTMLDPTCTSWAFLQDYYHAAGIRRSSCCC